MQNIVQCFKKMKLSECFTFLAGGDADKLCFSETKDDMHPYPIYANALTNKGLYGYSSKYKIKDECITITGRGDIGNVFYRKGFFTPIVRLIVAIPRENINAKFMSYACSKIRFFNETTGVPQLTVPQVQGYKVLVPPLPEQEKIAEILGTWDLAIEKLTALIEQKKLLKKGLMQRLLTGKQRLPSFSAPWEKIAIRDFCDIKRGGSPRPIENYLTTSDDGLNWLKIGDISPDAKYIYKTESKIKKEGLSKTTLIHSGDFILSNSMSFGRPYIMRIEACIHDGWLALTNIKKDVSKEYLFYLLISSETQKKFEMCAAGSGVRNLNKDIVGEIRIKLPSLPEQKAIADILSKADEEIALLTRKLSALKEQKTGLMQKLLTGQIRVKVA